MYGGITFSDGGRNVGPTEQAEMWARRALGGEKRDASRGRAGDFVESMTAPDGPALPEILKAENAIGWLAEGLARLYAIEGLAQKFGGYFERLEVGPATATSVRIDARFRTSDHSGRVGEVHVKVPLA